MFLKNIGSCNTTVQPVLYYTVNLAFVNYFESFLTDTAEESSTPTEVETILPIAMEDYSQDPNFTIYCQDTSQFPEYLDQLAHVHYQKQAFLANAKEFLIEGRAGMENSEVSKTPLTAFWKFFCIHVHCGLSCLSICGYHYKHDNVVAPDVHAVQTA